ncbi:MAG: hypothetical protein OEZ01_13315, partial [Candidatus Heimdallarchaeota archaeon]|nr:hypothetical protein [Candidatus Heimdallarchaeota archaeon]
MTLEWGGRRYRPVAPTTQLRNRRDILPGRGRQEGVYLTGSFIQPSQQEGTTPVPTPPPYFANLALWWDATDTSTMTMVGSEVDSWTSKGYYTPTLQAETADRRPQYITDGGEGSSKAVKFRYNATSALRDLLFVKGSGYNFYEGEQTIFVVGKHITPSPVTTYGQSMPFGMYSSLSTNIYGANITQFNDRSLTRYIPQTTGSTTGRIITYTQNSLFTGIQGQNPYFDNVYGLDWNNLQPTYEQDIKFITGKGAYNLTTTLSAYTQSYIPTFDSFGMYGYRYSTF